MSIAVVTGSGRGIGRAIALRLVREGYRVVVNAKRGVAEAEETLRLAKEAGGDGAVVIADVASREGCRQLVQRTLDIFGGLDVFVNNAGLGLYAPFESADDKMIEKQLETTLKSVIYCSQEAARAMAKGGVIINVASIAGLMPFYGLSIYSAAKAAVINLTRALAVELAPRIRVNAVAPGVVKTKMGESLLKVLGVSEEEFARRNTLLGQMVEPEHVAEAVVALIKIPTITGQVLVVDSGESLRHGALLS
ncbi:SDR family oxidoreductase [Thermoproteus tenax]|uniref:Short-chain dehydrogenase/reductase family n=1 Tax=Thermoproteus tenax (strain ATCC 35583 / DSM 2078 / JCM 9277 / NBRC 100435 / Kra 1) TaxID=768679 RepID=G4RME8_THETK|nr:SDR family oxidoreductase [Thermoproteus tenax]CCC80779.1 short-chain dehydrogenase/reductase family [Thermoproteus tenax Kra 1]